MDDRSHMLAALALARRGLGTTWPNPSVGCVLVRDGRVIGRGVTAPGGRPHAEVVALRQAGAAARGATAYVSLEPCSHWGQTPPCADALVEAGVARVVIGAGDPDPRVNGAGLERLRAAGIEVVSGLLPAEAEAVNAGFFMRVREGRPLVTLKLATTLDGRLATGAGESQWITGPAARQAAHALRGESDAVMAGINTVLADNPELTCRIPGYKSVPMVRVVADTHLRIPLTARLIATAEAHPTWVLHRPGADPVRRQALESAGVRCIPISTDEAGLNMVEGLQALAAAGLTRLLVEGGARLAAALLRADLVDRVAWFHAPSVMGANGRPAAEAFGVERLHEMPRFVRETVRAVGDDVLTELRRDR
jgi:diaminohydroxyphosphoribosylaminopyrimidine deaminase / 5-amino-6-(5-phosphoribosylamino)uracil reductase